MQHNSIPVNTSEKQPVHLEHQQEQRMESFCVNKPLKSKNANNTVRQQSLKPNKVARSWLPLGKLGHLMIH